MIADLDSTITLKIRKDIITKVIMNFFNQISSWEQTSWVLRILTR